MNPLWPRLSSDTRLLGLLALIASQVESWSQAELMLATAESSRALQAWTDELVAARLATNERNRIALTPKGKIAAAMVNVLLDEGMC